MILKKSQELFLKGKEIVAQDRDDLDNFPCYIKRAKGAYVWDMDDNKYIDFTCAKGPIILGYSDERVDNAVIKHIRKNGNLFFTQYSDLKFKLAKKLIKHIPCAERVLFFRTGSCATTAATRVARTYSNKDIVLTSGYHGWHDWSLKMFPEFKSHDNYTFDFGYNIDVLNDLINKFKDNIACIFITLEPNFFSDDLFKQIKIIANDNQIILIYDEIKTGFRFALGGYQKYSNIIPDLATFSKGMANGYSISCLVGNRQIMEAANKTHLWGTYHSEQIAFIAALKTIDIIEKENVIDSITKRGTYFIDKLNALFLKNEIAVEIHKYPTMFHIVFEDDNFGNLFYKECLNNGVLFYPFDNQMIMFSHSIDILNEALSIIEGVIKLIKNEKYKSKFTHKRLIEYIKNETGLIE
jgi:glutamate-1-semialdehyde aminotransferase